MVDGVLHSENPVIAASSCIQRAPWLRMHIAMNLLSISLQREFFEFLLRQLHISL